MELYDLPTAEEYADFARSWSSESPVFRDWATHVADDAEVLTLLETLPGPKRQPNLVFAAARWHGAEPGPYANLRTVLTGRWDDVRATALSRATQTNEVGRCATLLPLIASIPGPLALIEVGCSAGLCLFPDRYSHRWIAPSGEITTLDPADGPSPVVLECDVYGDPPLPTTMPEVRWRGGLDLAPPDLHDEDAMAWLRTLVWPGQQRRLQRLDAAIAVARTEASHHVVRGDLRTDLPALLADVPPGLTPVVLHSAVLAYLAPPDRDAFDATMRGLVSDGACHWVSNEAPQVLPQVTGDAEVPEGRFVLGLDGRAVGWTHGHGHELGWRAA